MIIQREKKNKAILAYTTKTSRAVYHQKSKKLGFKSTSRMILQALDFLIKTLENGITMNKIAGPDSKDPVWNAWQKKSDKDKIKEKVEKTVHGAVVKEMKNIFKLNGGYEFKKAEVKQLNDKELLELNKKFNKNKDENNQIEIYVNTLDITYKNLNQEDIPQ